MYIYEWLAGWLVGWLAGYMPLALTHVDSIRSLGSSSHAMHACMSFVSRTIFLFFSLSLLLSFLLGGH